MCGPRHSGGGWVVSQVVPQGIWRCRKKFVSLAVVYFFLCVVNKMTTRKYVLHYIRKCLWIWVERLEMRPRSGYHTSTHFLRSLVGQYTVFIYFRCFYELDAILQPHVLGFSDTLVTEGGKWPTEKTMKYNYMIDFHILVNFKGYTAGKITPMAHPS